MKSETKLVAIVGGSGAGKTWLARRLEEKLRPDAALLSLDDFYHDQSSLAPRQRAQVNYDHPRAIDWRRLETVLHAFKDGKPICVPKYDFVTHTSAEGELLTATRVVLIDGLWLLLRPHIRALFNFSIYLDCPTPLRLERRLSRDVAERGRTSGAAREQFLKDVVPMHERYVAHQATDADIVLNRSPRQTEVENLAETIRALMTEDEPQPEALPLTWPIIGNSPPLFRQLRTGATKTDLPIFNHQN